jgi:hypothetical protein
LAAAINPKVSAETIKCKYTTTIFWESGPHKYACQVEDNGIFNGYRFNVDRSQGSHLGSNTNDHVQAIYFNDIPNLTNFPTNIAKVFKNLIEIVVKRTKLNEISSEDLRPFPLLKSLQLINNKDLVVIRAGTFVHNPRLEVLNFSGSGIAHVEPKTLTGLHYLRALYFGDTPCKSLNYATTRDGVGSMVRAIDAEACHADIHTTTEPPKTTQHPMSEMIDDNDKKIQKLKSDIQRVKLENIKSQSEVFMVTNRFDTEEHKMQVLKRNMQVLTNSINDSEMELQRCTKKNVNLASGNPLPTATVPQFTSYDDLKQQVNHCTKVREEAKKIFEEMFGRRR